MLSKPQSMSYDVTDYEDLLEGRDVCDPLTLRDYYVR